MPTAKVIAVVLVGVVVFKFYGWEEPDPLLVHTAQGTVRGIKEYSEKGNPFFSYYSIPYAKPPVGELRLQDPVEADPWEGIWNGTSQPEPCFQISLVKLKMGTMTDEDVFGSEDCLYLNVFTPMASVEGRLPVMVFLHGGGSFWGSARLYPPYTLLNQRVVLVVPQYRLGTVGFLSTEDSIMPGNLGVKDQSLALRWVQRNIHVFGGDPDRVTLFGESAGASNTHLHVLSPKSAGLFSRAILQSGTALCPFAVTEGHRKMAIDWAQRLGCPDTSDSRQILSCLQRVDIRKLTIVPTQTFVWFLLPAVLLPRVDGDFLPSDPATLISEARHSKVDLITGINDHDGSFITHVLFHNENMLAQLRDNLTEIGPISLLLYEDKQTSLTIASRIFDHYLGGASVDVAHSDDVTEFVEMLYTVSASSLWSSPEPLAESVGFHHQPSLSVHTPVFGVPNDLSARLHARNTNPDRNTYIFQLMHRGQHSISDLLNVQVGKHWVSHADDLIYLFSGGPLYPQALLEHPEDLRLRDIMTSLWVNFATTGNPTPDDSLGFTWETATEDNLHYLSLTPTPSMHQDSRRQVRKFFGSLPTKQNQILKQHLKEDL
ncbi:carboxylic ester hydrolase-like [Panulirus ornatus]|uniref:carboxylic ester hydrolase-like n=1 Tax=Panulirus ornatus TaxID=150431 RepID=UPI003A89297E